MNECVSTSRRPAEATVNLGSRGGAAEVRLAESSSWSSALAPRCQHVPMNWMWMGGQEHRKVRRFSYQPKQPGKSNLFSSGGCCGRGGFGALFLFPGPAVTKLCRLETAGMHSHSGSWKSEVKVWAGPHSILEAPGKDPSGFSQLLVAPGVPGLWSHCCYV